MIAVRCLSPRVLLPLFFCVFLLPGLGTTALGSEAGRLSRLIEASVDLDGSVAPPGDTITAAVVVAPGAVSGHLEVRAYLVTGDKNERQEAVGGKTPSYRTKAGAFLAKLPLVAGGAIVAPEGTAALPAERERNHGGSLGFRRQIVIPYDQLAVPKGEHRLGYTVALIVDDETVDFTTLALTNLTVSDGVRTEIRRPHNREKIETVSLQQDVLVMTPSGLERRTIEVSSQRSIAFAEVVTQQTNIPGKYERHPIYTQGNPTPSAEVFVPASQQTIYFATNRQEIGPGLPAARRFGDHSIAPDDPLAYGAYAVSVPLAIHERGKVEQPKSWWWFWKETPNPEKHFVVLDGDVHSSPRLSAEEVSRRFGDKDVLLYVHGFNNSFEDALVRAAQLQHDLRFSGNMMAFSWPSADRLLFSDNFRIEKPDNLLAYDADRKEADKSAPFLAKALDHLLASVAQARPDIKVHVIAHSMGNYVLLNALAKLQGAKHGQPHLFPRLGEVVLAAPDVTDGEFYSLHAALFASSDRVTLYSSADDVALRMSQLKKGQRPIGLWPLVDPLNALDTISANGAFSTFYDDGHSYFGNTIAVLTDISFLVNLRKPPLERRPPLGQRVESPQLNGAFYWTVDATYLP